MSKPLDENFVHVAPAPVLARLERLDYRVVCGVEVLGCVLVLASIAASDVSAREALAQANPRVSHPQTILTTLRGRGCVFVDLVGVRAPLPLEHPGEPPHHAGAVSSPARLASSDLTARPLPSIRSPAATALTSASAAATNMAVRKPATKASSMALCTAAAVSPSRPSGTSAPPRSTFPASSCCCACGGRSRASTRASRPGEKATKTKMPRIGMASRLPVRETALLTPEASPECLPETEFIAVVVSGAMTSAIPKPCTTTAGKNVVQ